VAPGIGQKFKIARKSYTTANMIIYGYLARSIKP
jgi:hypothetical protein